MQSGNGTRKEVQLLLFTCQEGCLVSLDAWLPPNKLSLRQLQLVPVECHVGCCKVILGIVKVEREQTLGSFIIPSKLCGARKTHQQRVEARVRKNGRLVIHQGQLNCSKNLSVLNCSSVSPWYRNIVSRARVWLRECATKYHCVTRVGVCNCNRSRQSGQNY